MSSCCQIDLKREQSGFFFARSIEGRTGTNVYTCVNWQREKLILISFHECFQDFHQTKLTLSKTGTIVCTVSDEYLLVNRTMHVR